MGKNKARILIVEDSAFYQMYLRRVISTDPVLEVAGVAASGQEALAMAGTLKPDLITLDLHLPDVTGFELLQKLIRTVHIPVIVVTSVPEACERAIRMGARDFLEKNLTASRDTAAHFEVLLKLKIKMNIMARTGNSAQTVREKISPRKLSVDLEYQKQRLIVMGASIGGTETTLQILRQLPDCLPGIVLVQHMSEGFTKAYAMHLDRSCMLAVREARTGDAVLPGTVLVAPAGRQLTVVRTESGYRVRCGDSRRVGGFCPSVDVLFDSAAQAAGSRAMGIILTGMGRDGAEGLARMRRNGAYTVGQSEESCAVFGMPAAARAAGAVEELLSPEEIARRIVRQFGQTAEKT